MKLDLSKKIVEFLSQTPEQKFTAREIAEWIFENNPKAMDAKRKRSTAKDNKLKRVVPSIFLSFSRESFY